jgi:starch phosphorylase
VFLEDYDIDVARYLVQGVDIWLNTPRPPMEASGTSGMKAAMNGALNFSTWDGWWREGYTPDGGWTIGSGEDYEDAGYQVMVESQAIYNMLENEIVPLFYTRSVDGLPRAWIHRMKSTIKWVTPRFNTDRMVGEYSDRFYNKSAERWRYLTAEAMARAKALSMWKNKIKDAWGNFAIKDVKIVIEDGDKNEPVNLRQRRLKVGSKLYARALVKLDGVDPEDVSVELYHGAVDSWGNIKDGVSTDMEHEEANGDEYGEHWFGCEMTCESSGRRGLAVRILPKHKDLCGKHDLGLILWEGSA